MKTITFTYTEADPAATLQRAKMLGYKERIMDETQLVDGKIPMVQAVDADGTLMYKENITFNEETMEVVSREFELDANGEKIPVMVQKDITIDNPVQPVDFMADKARKNVAQFMAGGIAKQIIDAAKLQAEQVLKDAEAQVEATKEAVKDSIGVTVV